MDQSSQELELMDARGPPKLRKLINYEINIEFMINSPIKYHNSAHVILININNKCNLKN